MSYVSVHSTDIAETLHNYMAELLTVNERKPWQ